MLQEKISELQLQEAVREYFIGHGFVVTLEMQFFSKRIDLFAVNRKSLTTIAIETKLSNWKRASFQARTYLLCADYVFVALPSYLAHNVATKGFDRDSIGLLAVQILETSPLTCDVSIIIPAPESVYKRTDYVDKLRGAVLFARFDKRRESVYVG